MMYTSPLLQYIGEMAKDYIYAVVPLLVDAMMERDQVHRQIAIDAVAHLALGRLLYYLCNNSCRRHTLSYTHTPAGQGKG